MATAAAVMAAVENTVKGLARALLMQRQPLVPVAKHRRGHTALALALELIVPTATLTLALVSVLMLMAMLADLLLLCSARTTIVWTLAAGAAAAAVAGGTRDGGGRTPLHPLLLRLHLPMPLRTLTPVRMRMAMT